MAYNSMSFFTLCNLGECHLENLSRWLSCNGEIWGIGPTLVFASAAALFLYHELEDAFYVPGDNVQITHMEKTLVTSMVLGMLSLMVHLWVCLMRFFQYYLDTLIKDSPSVIIEMTTFGLLGSDVVPFGPLMKFLRQQQPQIHITVCWFLALCYADYVRKRYCRRFNMPFLEQWQMQMQHRASRGVSSTVAAVSSFVGCLQQRLRGFSHQDDQPQSNTTPHNQQQQQPREYTVEVVEPKTAGPPDKVTFRLSFKLDNKNLWDLTVKEPQTCPPSLATPRHQLPVAESVLPACRTFIPRENSVFTLPLEPCPMVTSSRNRIFFPMAEPLTSMNPQSDYLPALLESSINSEVSSRKPDASAQTLEPTSRRRQHHKHRYRLFHFSTKDYRS